MLLHATGQVGKSGGGKSTLIHLLMRFYDPSSGRILLDGQDLADMNLRSLHENTGLVSQLRYLSVILHICCKARNCMVLYVGSAGYTALWLQCRGEHRLRARAPRVHRRGAQRSGGACQRVGVHLQVQARLQDAHRREGRCVSISSVMRA